MVSWKKLFWRELRLRGFSSVRWHYLLRTKTLHFATGAKTGVKLQPSRIIVSQCSSKSSLSKSALARKILTVSFITFYWLFSWLTTIDTTWSQNSLLNFYCLSFVRKRLPCSLAYKLRILWFFFTGCALSAVYLPQSCPKRIVGILGKQIDVSSESRQIHPSPSSGNI